MAGALVFSAAAAWSLAGLSAGVENTGAGNAGVIAVSATSPAPAVAAEEHAADRAKFERSLHRYIARSLPEEAQEALAEAGLLEGEGGAMGGLPVLCFAPGTSEEYIASFAGLGNPSSTRFQAPDRWTSTATNGGGLQRGEPITLTYSFVPDGTTIPAATGFPGGSSNLRAWLTGIYGSEAAWQQVFHDSFARWQEVSGITYVYEPNDDGSTLNGAGGSLGVRGDLRISGYTLDGNSNVLAYNSFPNDGDMVFDTADNFFNTLSSSSIRMRNVITHEHGHGMGLAHNCPILGEKLMEPFINLGFFGPQHDEVRAVQFLYGDPFEPDNSRAAANPLGTLSIGQSVSPGDMPPPAVAQTSILSIDSNGEQDWFSFQVTEPASVNVTVSPLGFVYQDNPQACQGQSGACCSGTTVDSLRIADLAVEVIGPNGTTVLAAGSEAPLGEAEVLVDVPLPSAGTYYVRVYETNVPSESQMYDLDVLIGPALALPLTLELLDGPVDSVEPGVEAEVRVSVDLGDDTMLGGVLLASTIDGTSQTVVTMTDAGNGEWVGTLPVVACGENLAWAVTTVGQSTGTVRLPASGNYHPLTGTVVTAFSDNFETSQGWTVENDATPGETFDGGWTAGVPAGAGDRSDPPTDYDGSGRCWLTDNVAGNSDVDGGSTTLISPVIDVTGLSEVTITYARWYNNAEGAAPQADTFEVDISSDGGTNWVDLETVGPATTSPIGDVVGGWVEVSYGLEGVAPATAGLRLRFIASDLGDGSLVEAAVDAVSVVGVMCEDIDPEPCPCDFDASGTQDLNDYFAYLGSFLAELNVGNPQPGTSDFDGSGVVDLNDYFAYLGCLSTLASQTPCP